MTEQKKLYVYNIRKQLIDITTLPEAAKKYKVKKCNISGSIRLNRLVNGHYFFKRELLKPDDKIIETQ